MSNGDFVLLPEAPDLPYKLGRHVAHDPRNREFPVRGILPATLQGKDSPWWRTGVFDQGTESSCTAQATAGCLITSPLRMRLPRKKSRGGPPDAVDKLQDAALRYQLYREAQRHDPWDGDEETEPRYEGSSGLAACKAAKVLGLVPASWEYRWAFGIGDVLDALQVGPVSFGTVWLYSMFRTNKDGKLVVDRNSAVAGGHQVELIWHDSYDARVVGVNSWGKGWGKNGRFYLSIDDLRWLLEQDGDAVVWVPS